MVSNVPCSNATWDCYIEGEQSTTAGQGLLEDMSLAELKERLAVAGGGGATSIRIHTTFE